MAKAEIHTVTQDCFQFVLKTSDIRNYIMDVNQYRTYDCDVNNTGNPSDSIVKNPSTYS